MSKLAIVLCALLFASAANGYIWSNALKTAQNKAEQLVNGAIYEVDDRIKASQNMVQEVAGNLMNEAMKLSGQVQDEIKQILNKAEHEITKYSSTVAIGIDVAECSKSLSDLDKAGLAIMSEMSQCITEKLEAGSGYVESIFQVSRDAQDNLYEISYETRRCVEQITGIRSTFAAISCSKDIASKAAWMVPKIIRTMSVKISELTFMLGTLKPSLAYCMTTNGLMSLYRESSAIVEKAKKCIQHKVDKTPTTQFPVSQTPKEFLPHPDSKNKEVAITERVSTEQEFTNEKKATTEHYTPEKEATTEHGWTVEKVATTEHEWTPEKVATTEQRFVPEKIATTEHVFVDEQVATTEQVVWPKKVAITERTNTDEHVSTSEQAYATEDVFNFNKIATTEKVHTAKENLAGAEEPLSNVNLW